MLIENLQIIFITNGTILLIPGFNFALIAYNATNKSLRAGLLCTLGVTMAITIHAVAALLGAITLFNAYPSYFETIKICGGFFLCFIGFSIFISLFKSTQEKKFIFSESLPFLQGFVTDLFNSIVFLFYVSLFTRIVTDQVPNTELGLYILFVIFLTFSWFALIARLFSINFIQKFSNRYITKVKFVASLLLFYYGMGMILS